RCARTSPPSPSCWGGRRAASTSVSTSWPSCSAPTRTCWAGTRGGCRGGGRPPPPVLFMDEPYSTVDPIVRARRQDELIDLQRRVKKTIVLVTHDIDEAIRSEERRVGG